MNAEQEQQIVKSLNQIAYSLEYLTRFASALCVKFGIQQPPPPDIQNYGGSVPQQRR